MYKLGQYVSRESIVHQLDPRIKIITVIALSIMILKMNTVGLLAVSLMVIIISLLAYINPGSLVKTLRPVWPFFFCLFLLYLFFTPGKPIPPFPIGPVQISYAGLNLGLLQIGKFVLLVLAASLLTMTTNASQITSGLERLLRPLKMINISSHNIAMLMSLALRFLPTLLEQMQQISEAQLSRGAHFNPRRLFGKIKAISYLTIPLLINIFRQSDQLADAMEARGYQPGPRTYLHELTLNRNDYCALGFVGMGMLLTYLL